MTTTINAWPAIRTGLINRRKALKLSQRDLARRMGVVQSMVASLESGRSACPTLITLSRWSAALELEGTLSFYGGGGSTAPLHISLTRQ